jgi:TPR repeat protein
MQKLEISGAAEAFTDPRGTKRISDPALLSELHGIHSDELCAAYFDKEDSFGDLGVKGGRLRFVFDPKKGKLRITTTYVMPNKLDKENANKLVKFTAAQWSDGMGSGRFEDCGREILSTALASAILNTSPSRTDLGSHFVDAFPMSGGDPEITWSEGEHFDEDLIADLKRKSDAGNDLAQLELGQRFERGDGVKKDMAQAFALFEKSAQHNHPASLTKLALCYLQGKGASADHVKAYNLVTKAAENDFPMALGILGDLYQQGLGTQQDMKKGFAMYKRGSELGDFICLSQVASCYEEGKGVQKDLREALRHYEECHKHGVKVRDEIERIKSQLK